MFEFLGILRYKSLVYWQSTGPIIGIREPTPFLNKSCGFTIKRCRQNGNRVDPFQTAPLGKFRIITLWSFCSFFGLSLATLRDTKLSSCVLNVSEIP